MARELRAPERGAVLQGSEGALALFSRSYRKAAIKAALVAMAQMWVKVYLPTRFTGKARRLGWHITPTWQRQKDFMARHYPDAKNPLVYTGTLREALLDGGAKVGEARVSAHGARVTILMKFPPSRITEDKRGKKTPSYGYAPVVAAVLSATPPVEEQDAMNKVFAETLAQIISDGKNTNKVLQRGGGVSQRRTASVTARS